MATAVLTVAGIGSANAQRTPRTFGSDVATIVSDMAFVWRAPLRAEATDWATAALTLGGVLLVGAIDADVQDAVRSHPKSLPMRVLAPWRMSSDVQLWHLGGARGIYPMSLPLYALGFALDSRPLREAAMGCLSAYQAQGVVHALTYHVVSRKRPYVSVGRPYAIELGHGDWDLHSFYNGHAANFLTCATFWSRYFRLGAAEPALYIIGLGIGLGRIADERHWASDTALGMIMGHVVGRMVAGRYAPRRARRGAGSASSDQPVGGQHVLGSDAPTVRIGWRLRF